MASAKRVSVFIDSGVFYAAAISARGGARELLIAALAEGQFLLSLSAFVLEETGRNLAARNPETLPYYVVLRRFLTAGQVYPAEGLVRRARISALDEITSETRSCFQTLRQ